MNGNVKITRVRAFGWCFHWVRGDTGTWYDMAVSRPSSVKDCGVYSFYTKGLLHGVNLTTGQRMPDRVPGLLSTTLPDIPAGIYRYTAQEPSEWWCIDQKFNSGLHPPVMGRKLAAGETATGKILVTTGPDRATTHDSSYTASQECYIMVIDHDAP